MGKYLLNRILWIVPTVWFTVSAVFILIKLIPSQAPFLLEEDASISIASRDDIYRQYLERTGQNLPLFYFSIRSGAEPDSLYTIQPYKEQQFLKRMLLEYGNWPLIVEFYTHFQNLKHLSSRLPDSILRLYYQKQIAKLIQARNEAAIQQIFSEIRTTSQRHVVNDEIGSALEATSQSFAWLQQNKKPYKKYIPAIHWHGNQNQYHQWLINAASGDLGISLRDARPVQHILTEAIGNTLLLSVYSLLLIFAIAILLNFVMAHEDYLQSRKAILNALYIVDTIPLFLLALLLIILLADSQYLHIFPIYGLGDVPENANWLQQLLIHLHHLFIPVICLTLSNIPYVSGQLYAAMTEVKQSEYIQTARAKGVKEWNIVSKHIFKNALLPLITLFSGFIPALLGGAVVIEVIFVIPGMGQLLVASVLARDYPVILGIILIMALAKITAHIVADILYYLADPRIRFS